MKKFLVAACVLFSVALMSSVSRADMAPGLFRLHMSTTLLEVGTGETSVDRNDDQYGGLEVGIGMDRHAIGFGFSLGGGIVVGGRVALGQESGDWNPGSEDEHFVLSALPYFEYVFLTTRVRPFVKAQLGLEGAHYNNNDGFWGLLFGGGGGLHIFLRPEVSLDMDLDLGFRVGTGHWDNGPGPDTDYNHWRFSFATLIGLSAWL